MNASLAKIPFICSVVWDIYQNLTPPSPPPPPSNRLPVKGNLIEQYVVPYVGILKAGARCGSKMFSAWINFLAEGYAGSWLPRGGSYTRWQLSQCARRNLPPGGLGALQITTPFLAGWALNLASTLLRVHCYHRLDRHFTFELAIQKEQKLVTDGVYSIVRHPSYSATILACIGYSVAQFCPGSWLYEYLGVMPTAALGVGLSAIVAAIFGERIRTEDVMLKKSFGEQWEEWAKRVPYRIIPGVL